MLVHPQYLTSLINAAFDRSAESAEDVMKNVVSEGEIETNDTILVGEDLLDNPRLLRW